MSLHNSAKTLNINRPVWVAFLKQVGDRWPVICRGGSSDLTAPGGGGGGDGNRSDKISTVSLIGVYYNNEKGLQVKIR